MSEGISIYALCDPDGTVRYIGKSRNVHWRIMNHLGSRNASDTPVYKWLRHLKAGGNEPSYKVLMVVAEGDADEAEQRCIAEYAAAGTLVNRTHNPQPPVIFDAPDARMGSIMTRIPAHVYDWLAERARREGIPMSVIIRGIILDALRDGRDEKGEMP